MNLDTMEFFTSKLQVEFVEQLIDVEAVVGGYVFKDVVQCTDFDWIVIRHGDVMLAALLCHQTDVGAGLPRHRVAEFSQSADQFRPVAVAGRFHTVRTSSRTKCKRMIPGRSGSFSSK